MKQFVALGVAVVAAIALSSQASAQCCGSAGVYSAPASYGYGYSAPVYHSGYQHCGYNSGHCGNYCGTRFGGRLGRRGACCNNYCGTSCGNYGCQTASYAPTTGSYCGTTWNAAPVSWQGSCGSGCGGCGNCGGGWASAIPAYSGSSCCGGCSGGYPVMGGGYMYGTPVNSGCPGCVGGQMIMDGNALPQTGDTIVEPGVNEGGEATPSTPPQPDDT